MRAFLAIELPEAVRGSLNQAIARLRKSIAGRAAWVREDNLHITVRFLGDVEDAVLEALVERIAPRLEAESAIPLRIGGLGVFPNPRRAKVLWSGGQGDLERLLLVQAECEAAARACGLEADPRVWSPHVTLARFREPPHPSALRKALDTFAEYEAGEFDVPGVTLFSSRLTPQGAVYTPIRKFPFSCPST